MIDFGTVKPGTTLYIPFATYDSNDPTASVTMTGLAVTDIEIYKNGGTTQRSSDNGYALLDTDGIDFDSLTGIHGFSVSLADNTDAGFYSAGAQYWIVVSSVTVDAGTVSFIAATFRIGYPDAVLDTTIATLSSQTSFTLTAGPADDNALVGAVCLVHDVASAVQIAQGVVSAYTGATKTVTLAVDPAIFTMAAGDNISFFPGVNVRYVSEDKTAADNLEAACDGGSYNVGGGAVVAASVTGAVGSVTGNVGGNVAGSVASVTAGVTLANGAITAAVIATGAIDADAIADNAIDAGAIAADAITAAKIAAGAIDAATFAADVDAEARGWLGLATNNIDTQLAALPTAAEIEDEVLDALLSAHTDVGSVGAGIAAAGGAGDPWSTALPGAYGAGTAGKIVGDNLNAPVGTVDTVVDGLATTLGVAGAGLTALGDARLANLDATVSSRLATAGYTAPLDAAGVRTAVGMAAADLDAQLDALPTDADVQTAAAAALTAYDPPTHAEVTAGFTEIKGATWDSGTDTLEAIRNKETDIETDTQDLQTQVGVDGAGLTSIGDARLANLDAAVSSRSTVTTAEVNAQCDTAISDAALATAAALATVDANVDDILADTGTAGVVVATASKTGYALSATGVDGVLDEAIGDGTITMRQALKALVAAVGGILSGAATTSITIRNNADTADVIVATVDADGNRSAVTLNV